MEQVGIKKSIKPKPPIIRQTLTSMFRIAKANPLLFIDDVPKYQNGPSSLDLNKSKLPNHMKPLPKTINENTNKIQTKTVQLPKPTIRQKTMKPHPNPKLNGNKVVESKKVGFVKPSFNLAHPKPKPAAAIKPTQTKTSKFNEVAKPKPKSIKKRRSLSAEHYDRKKHVSFNLNQSKHEPLKCVSPIEERRVTFQTPINSNHTPMHFIRNHSTPYIMRTNYKHSDLQKKLHEWLRLRKKSFGSYKNLQNFGVGKNNEFCDDENKENIEVECAVNGSYEDLGIKTPVISFNKHEDLQDVIQGVLSDLHRLISEGFSIDQSEAWLNLISQKYHYLENEPQYWECRAAIEQSRGNITSAVDCLTEAIVKGAEVKFIDRSLEELLQKFSLLNINSPSVLNIGESTKKKDRIRIIQEARTAFKSNIIQFAIQERNIKNKAQEGLLEKKYVATPVRRSTRLTPSKYRVTPKVQLFSSLHDLDEGIKSNMDFYGNKQLNVRFSSVKKKKD